MFLSIQSMEKLHCCRCCYLPTYFPEPTFIYNNFTFTCSFHNHTKFTFYPMLESYKNKSVDLFGNPLPGFYMIETLAFNELIKHRCSDFSSEIVATYGRVGTYKNQRVLLRLMKIKIYQMWTPLQCKWISV